MKNRSLLYLTLILVLVLLSCQKQGPSPKNIERFLGTWHSSDFCEYRQNLTIILREGAEPGTLILSGQISVTIAGDTFSGDSGMLNHYGEINSDGALQYCQEGSSGGQTITCCGTFTKEL